MPVETLEGRLETYTDEDLEKLRDLVGLKLEDSSVDGLGDGRKRKLFQRLRDGLDREIRRRTSAAAGGIVGEVLPALAVVGGSVAIIVVLLKVL